MTLRQLAEFFRYCPKPTPSNTLITMKADDDKMTSNGPERNDPDSVNRRLEGEMRQQGVERAQRNRDPSRKTLDKTKAGLEAVAANIVPVESMLRFQLQMRKDVSGGPKPFWETWLYRCDLHWSAAMKDQNGDPIYNEPDAVNLANVADMALRVCEEGVSKNWTLADLGMALGESFANYCWMRSLEHTNEGRYTVTQFDRISQISTSSNETRRAKAMRVARENGYLEEEWTDGEIWRCGAILWNAVVMATDMYTKILIKGDPDKDKWKSYHVVLTPKWEQILEKRNTVLDSLAPLYAPMAVRPFKWDEQHIGPYRWPALAKGVKLVRNTSKDHKAEIEDRRKTGGMDLPLQAINCLQETPYVINEYVLAAMDWVRLRRQRSVDVNDFPSLKPVKVPRKEQAEYDAMTRSERADFNFQRAERKAENRAVLGNRMQLARWSKQAHRLLGEDKWIGPVEKFYMPHNFDRRGRVYHVPEFGHHNTDVLRALFSFANKKPIGNNYNYFLQSLANHMGHDKIANHKRWEWAMVNEELIEATGRNFKDTKDNLKLFDLYEPVEHEDGSVTMEVVGKTTVYDFWRNASAPFQFLAACHEFANLVDYMETFGRDKRSDFLSGLPIALDCTQSGIQHYALATRDYDDAYLTNVIGQDKPNDLYSACLTEAKKLLREKLEEDEAAYAANPLTKKDEAAIAEFKAFMDDDEKTSKQRKARRDRFKRTVAGRKERLVREIDAVKRTLAYDGYNRSFIKRNAMTFAYSSRRYGFAEQIKTDHMKPLSRQVWREEIEEHPFGPDNGATASTVLGAIHERAIRNVVTSVSKGMDFFQSCADALTTWNLHFGFDTKWGFPMRQYYEHETESDYRPNTWLFNEKLPDTIPLEMRIDRENDSTKIARYNGIVNERRSRNAISPNIIHAQDSLLLQMTVLLCDQEDVRDLMVVHDSFSACIGDARTMHRLIKEATCDLYLEYDLFDDIETQVRAKLQRYIVQAENSEKVTALQNRILRFQNRLRKNREDFVAIQELEFIETLLSLNEYELNLAVLMETQPEDAPELPDNVIRAMTDHLLKPRPDREAGKLDVTAVLSSDYYVN